MGTHFEKAAHYPTREPQPERPDRPLRKRKMAALLAGFIFVAMALTWADVIEWKDGAPQLKPAREIQLKRDIKEIEGAEQYALLALTSGFYPCALCPIGRLF